LRAASVASQVAGGLRQLSQAFRASCARFAEVGEQPHAPAIVRFGQRQQRVELAALAALELLGGRALIDHAPLIDHIGQAVGHPGVGWLAVAAGAAGLLVVGLDIFRQIEVRDEAHVGLVDAHAESDRGDHHDALFAQETVLVQAAHVGVESSVVGQRSDAVLGEPAGGFFNFPARLAIHDPCVALVLVADKAQQLRSRVAFLDHGVADVRPVEAADEDARCAERQAFDDVAARQPVGRCRQGDARHLRIALVQHVERQVVDAEIVAPLAHAMRLVDGEQAEQAARVQGVELAEHARRGQAFGRDIEQHQPTAQHLALDLLGFGKRQRRIQESGVHAGHFERPDLIVHQCNQRTHDHRHAMSGTVPGNRRHLVAEALAAAGGHQHQRIAAAAHVRDDLGLRAAKGAIAKDVA
jgi:hypothetical protein